MLLSDKRSEARWGKQYLLLPPHSVCRANSWLLQVQKIDTHCWGTSRWAVERAGMFDLKNKSKLIPHTSSEWKRKTARNAHVHANSFSPFHARFALALARSGDERMRTCRRRHPNKIIQIPFDEFKQKRNVAAKGLAREGGTDLCEMDSILE